MNVSGNFISCSIISFFNAVRPIDVQSQTEPAGNRVDAEELHLVGIARRGATIGVGHNLSHTGRSALGGRIHYGCTVHNFIKIDGDGKGICLHNAAYLGFEVGFAEEH